MVISRTVGPVCLAPASADPDQYADQSAVIMGWGLECNERSSTDNSCGLKIRNSFVCSIADSYITGTVLKQGTVLISSNSDCKADENFGKYVTDANICISATDKFVCPVGHQFYSFCWSIKSVWIFRMTSAVQWSFSRRRVFELRSESTASIHQVIISIRRFGFCTD